MKSLRIMMAFVLLVLLLALPQNVFAASTADATAAIDTSQLCTLTVTFAADEVYPGILAEIYQVADISSDFIYTATADFADKHLPLNGTTATQTDELGDTVAAYILADDIAPTATVTANSDGVATKTALPCGLYYVAVEEPFVSFLVTLPGLDADGSWQSEVSVLPKAEVIPPSPTPTPTPTLRNIRLLWDDSGKARPESVTIEIYLNKTLYETQTLSNANNWSYSWSATESGPWTVVVRNLADNYNATISEANNVYTVTAIELLPEEPQPEEPQPEEPKPQEPKPQEPQPAPNTGGRGVLLILWTAIATSGSVLMGMACIARKEKNGEKA